MFALADWALPAVPYLTVLMILLPLISAAFILVFRGVNLQRFIALLTLATLTVMSAVLIIVADTHGIQTVQMGGWEAPIGITLVADRLSSIMLFVSSIVLVAVMWYGISQGLRDGDDDDPIAVFLPSYMLLSMGVNLSFLAGDLFNLYVGFEIFLVASYVLLTLGASPQRVRAGIGYVMVSMASSMVFLFALALVYASVGTVNMAQAGIRMEDVPNGTKAAIFATILIAFGIKAAVFPLDAWLPDSYPTAASIVTAVFAGLLTKVGVYAIIRMRSTVFTDGSLDSMLMWVALLTMIVGVMGAIAQNDIKRLMSFTLVSHIGYMIFGVALGSVAGLSGAIFYAVHHILVQTSLFLVVGLVERQAGSAQLRRLGSLLYTAPVIGVLYLVPALNLGGIPPLSGFLGKVMLIQAGAEDGSWLAWTLIGGAVVTSLLTLYAMMNVWSKGFLRDRADAPEGDVVLARPANLAERGETVSAGERDDVGRIPVGMFLSTALLVLTSTSITFLAGPISNITDRAAQSAQDVTIYRSAVLIDDPTQATRNLDAFTEPTDSQGGHDSLMNRRNQEVRN
ncbi:Na+/H+ antiporter subunit D [Corynebacterium coyleae]|uniref:Na+/H+ antiporter subunit D n=1 Tax=Corynebacterium coyleae TaxID=53374 RepID=UPI00254E3AA1|nr:Na+/H+ antiporter subunit D [Corynebacterium coyleae]MDK8664344.1 Na+/H+ antiporter subunit D [Corynebacterium coyleae]MDK8707618.1 Na+/H+ antiporter subunit D [Corynebacterium coyleae]MDK8734474.1 Na+/H+ antiporter subunit D [Corynebacterium coyleae]MDK8893461.1 Na+/H+ antiporter subunit D [Corynebacterium coyleae]